MKKNFTGLRLLLFGLLIAVVLLFLASSQFPSVYASTIEKEGNAFVLPSNTPVQGPLVAKETTEEGQQDWWALLSQIAKARRSYILVTFTDRVIVPNGYSEVQGFTPDSLIDRFAGLDRQQLSSSFYRVQLVHEEEGSYIFAYTWNHEDVALGKPESLGSINVHWEGQDPSLGFWVHIQFNKDGSFTQNPVVKIDMKH